VHETALELERYREFYQKQISPEPICGEFPRDLKPRYCLDKAKRSLHTGFIVAPSAQKPHPSISGLGHSYASTEDINPETIPHPLL